jgi:hypothetical protein
MLKERLMDKIKVGVDDSLRVIPTMIELRTQVADMLDDEADAATLVSKANEIYQDIDRQLSSFNDEKEKLAQQLVIKAADLDPTSILPLLPYEPAQPITPEAPTVVDTPAVTVNGNVVAACVVGDVLTVTDGNWTGDPTAYARSWLSNGVEVGTDQTYTAQATDVDHSITCTVTATNAAGSTAAPTSNATIVNAGP